MTLVVLVLATSVAIASAKEEERAIKVRAITLQPAPVSAKEIEAIAIPEVPEEAKLVEQIKPIVKRPFVRPVTVWTGFIEKTDRSDAQLVRVVLSYAEFGKLLDALDPLTIEEIKKIKESQLSPEEKAKEIKELVKTRLPEVKGSIGGVLIIGMGAEHENYRLIAKEITDESASFYIARLEKATTVGAVPQPGLWERFVGGVKRAFRIAPAPAAPAVAAKAEIAPEFELIGELELRRTKYAALEIMRGSLKLESTKYAGNWEFVAFTRQELPKLPPYSAEELSQQPKQPKPLPVAPMPVAEAAEATKAVAVPLPQAK